MRILYLADIRFPMERANGIQTAETAHALARRGVEVELVVRRTDGRSGAECLAFFGLAPHRNLRLRRVRTPFGRPSYLGAALSLLLRSRGEWDVVYTRDLVLADLALRVGKAPVVYEAHTVAAVFAEERARLYVGEPRPSSRKLARLDSRERRVCRKAAGVVTITEALENALEERHRGIAASRVVPDGCRVPRELPPLDGFHSPPRVYYIGQLYPWKGVDLLVESMTRVKGAELVVVGGLPPEADLARLKRLASTLTLNDRVRFRGFVPPPELAAERASADVFVIPLLDSTTARLFTSPLKLFEAMAARRPIVASDLPSIREVLAHEENALLVRPGDGVALAAAIERLLDDRALSERLASRAFEDVNAYAWDRRAEAIDDFLAGVVAT
ncbi:MAG: glycosyltransferase family 4 protein [Vicinamibacteria bacterium]